MVPFLRAKKANVHTLGSRFSVKFPRVGKTIEVTTPHVPRVLPLGLNIDRCIIMLFTLQDQCFCLKDFTEMDGYLRDSMHAQQPEAGKTAHFFSGKEKRSLKSGKRFTRKW